MTYDSELVVHECAKFRPEIAHGTAIEFVTSCSRLRDFQDVIRQPS